MKPADMMAAFVAGDCRGVGVIIKVNDTSSVFYILIHGAASEQDKISFKYYSKASSYMYSTTDFLTFAVDSNFGTPDNPEVPALAPVK